MPNPTTIGDLEARWRPLTAAETTVATALLGDAWALLLARRPTLDADLTATTVSSENVIRVVSAMVLRVLKNPDGLSEEGVDDYRYKRDGLVSSGALHVTPGELVDIAPYSPRRHSVRLVIYGDA